MSAATEAGSSQGAPSAPPTIAALVEAFAQLEILELVGAGGMGAVFKARQPKLNRFVALKILPEALCHDPSFAERFAREGQLLARLSHPNIVTVHDFGQSGGFYFLLMEFVDGVNLRQAMRASRFTPAQALRIVPKICEALQYAHEEGVLHRDIKPENILLDAKGRVKLADFGIAKLAAEAEPTPAGAGKVDPALTQAGAALGTPQYMAPEQRERPAEVDHRADIYSLGVVFYELLTGELPAGVFVPPSTRSAADPRVDAIVAQALEKQRERRQESAGELGTQVETLHSLAAGDAAREHPAPRLSRPSPGPARWVGFLLIAGSIVWLGVIVAKRFPEPREPTAMEAGPRAESRPPSAATPSVQKQIPQSDVAAILGAELSRRLQATRAPENGLALSLSEAGEGTLLFQGVSWKDQQPIRGVFRVIDQRDGLWQVKGTAPFAEVAFTKHLALAFSPSWEMTVKGALDLDQAQPGPAERPGNLDEAALAPTGLDVVLDPAGRLLGVGLRTFVALENGPGWEQLSPAIVSDRLTHQVRATQSVEFKPGVGGPAIYLFQTREGARGVLEVLGATEEAVKMRYRLLQAPAEVLESPRKTVAEWWRCLRVDSADDFDDAWDLTTRSTSSGFGLEDKEFAASELPALHQLGHAEQVMVVSNPVRDGAGRERVFVAVLLKQHGRWLIDSHYQEAPGEAARRMEGFKMNPAMKFDVEPAELLGEWSDLGSLLNFSAEGKGSSKLGCPPAPGTKAEPFLWEVRGTTLRRRWADREETEEIVWIDHQTMRLQTAGAEQPQTLHRSPPRRVIPTPPLQFRLEAPEGDADAERLPSEQGEIRVRKEVVLDERDVAETSLVDEHSEARKIHLEFTAEGARKFGEATAANIGRRMVLLVRGRVLMAPVIREAIRGGSMEVAGNLTLAEFEALAPVAPALPEPAK